MTQRAPRRQIAFISFAFIFNSKFVTRFDFFDEIKRSNVAAGLLLGLQFCAVGYLMSNVTVKVRPPLTHAPFAAPTSP